MTSENPMAENTPVEIVLGIPGLWTDRTDIVSSIVDKSQDYVFFGGLLLDSKTNRHYGMEVDEPNPDLRRSFELAAPGSLAKPLLDDIDRHTFILYVRGPGGSLETAWTMMEVASALLRAGGLAVKVETTGKAFGPDQWLRCLEYKDSDPAALHDAFVTFINNGRELYTCGMHNLGYPDAVMAAQNSPQEAIKYLETFQFYILRENPNLADGHTFSVSADAPHYRMKLENYTFYPPGDLFHNPFGVWRLTPV